MSQGYYRLILFYKQKNNYPCPGQCAEETKKYRPEIERLTNEMNAVRKAEREDADSGWQRIFN